jgi:Fe-S-cluster containining protein
MNTEPILLLAILICAPGIAAYMIVRSYQAGKRDFKCLRCGSCCTYRVKLYPEDIKRLNDAGKTDYMTSLGHVKMKNDGCLFLVRDGKAARCSVYELRPKICRQYPISNWFFGKRMADLRCGAFTGKK